MDVVSGLVGPTEPEGLWVSCMVLPAYGGVDFYFDKYALDQISINNKVV